MDISRGDFDDSDEVEVDDIMDNDAVLDGSASFDPVTGISGNVSAAISRFLFRER